VVTSDKHHRGVRTVKERAVPQTPPPSGGAFPFQLGTSSRSIRQFPRSWSEQGSIWETSFLHLLPEAPGRWRSRPVLPHRSSA
jgi:hypothetical protein